MVMFLARIRQVLGLNGSPIAIILAEDFRVSLSPSKQMPYQYPKPRPWPVSSIFFPVIIHHHPPIRIHEINKINKLTVKWWHFAFLYSPLKKISFHVIINWSITLETVYLHRHNIAEFYILTMVTMKRPGINGMSNQFQYKSTWQKYVMKGTIQHILDSQKRVRRETQWLPYKFNV
jgi:hypothetical protein